MSELKITTVIPPSVNHYLDYKVGHAGRRSFVQSYPAVPTINYRNRVIRYVREQMELQGWEKPDENEHIKVYITFYFDRKRKDANNYLKVPFDVFTDAGVWIDDDKVLPIVNRVYIDRINPRAEFTIIKANFKGVFENDIEHGEFVEVNCNNCTKSTKKCTIMKKLLDNELLEEVENGVCNKAVLKIHLKE